MAETGPDREAWDDGAPRNIFSALWFRVLIVIIVLGVVVAIAVPYVRNMINPPAPKQVMVPRRPSVQPTPAPVMSPPAAPSPTPAPPPPVAVTPPAPTPPPAAVAPVAPAPRAPAPTTAAEPKTEPKGEAKPPAAPVAKAAEPPARTAGRPASAGSGPWWVQVGSFKDQQAAKRLAARLREQQYRVEESTKPGAPPGNTATVAAPPAGDRYNVFVSGVSSADINAKLGAKGLAADPVAGGAVIKPSLPLREAVALSRDLAEDGFRVQVRREGAKTETASAEAPGAMYYRVRVGGFPDRAAAQAAARELEGKGYKPFVARGGS